PELTPTQQQCLARHQATLARLATDYPRPRRMPYQGQPHLVVGVAMDLDHLLTAVLVDVTQSKVIKQVTLRGLLGDNYHLVQRLRHLQQRHAHARHVAQRRGAKVADRETNLAVHVERLIAKALVQFAQQHLAGSLCLPRLADLREMVQADVQARAEKRFPDSKELQRRYAKQYRVSAHRWSYQRLLTAIRQRASLMGVPVEEGLPDVRAAPWQRALSVALSAYYQRKAA
ncbi:MAG: type V CRISPR-associated protein Cas12k, partial [Gloeomargarita sp. SKYG98]|nr:type V CRISPR-associated protein Cas12k [Gloeomargarita sp. SKYG98]